MFNTHSTAEKSPRNKTRRPTNKKQLILNIIGIALCVILLPILIMNCTLIIKGMINEDEVPSLGRFTPLIVLTDSMYPEIKAGDLIICEKVEATDIVKGDVISFFDPAGNGSSVVTHRVTELYTEDGKIYFRTRGDNNNTEDRLAVPEDNLVGVWRGSRFFGIGNVAMFMQSTAGLIICIGAPLAALISYDLIRRKKLDKSKQSDMDALVAELNALKAAQQMSGENTEESEIAPKNDETNR